MAYCFGTVAGVPVVWLYGSIGPRSFEAVSRGLQQTARYREVWLNSPGGLVSEAFKIGLAFKRLGSTAVVPKHPQVHCVSACTIMILGAYNRTVEPGATFMIHAKSAFMNVDGTDKANAVATWAELAAHVAEDASRLIDVAQEITDEERASSTAYVGYVATALGGRPNSALLAQIASQPLAGPYGRGAPEPRSLERDVAMLNVQGVQAFQELLTQAELRAMRLMHGRMIERESELGVGAKVALRIFQANLACRIQDVCLLASHQLESLGYHNFTPDRLANK